MSTLRFHRCTHSARALSWWCALTLTVLTVLPFTPPFSTCNLSALFSGRVLHSVPGSTRGPSIAGGAFPVAPGGEGKELKDLASALVVLPAAMNLFAPGLPLRLASSAHAPLSLVSSPVLRI